MTLAENRVTRVRAPALPARGIHSALRIRCQAFVVVAIVGLAACVPPASAESGKGVDRRRTPGAGLLYYAKADYASADNSRVIANPSIAGALFQVIWSEIEKEEGGYDWREVDRWLEPWRAAGKKVAIRVLWCTSGAWPKPYYKKPTPSWVWQKGAVFAFHERTGTEIPLIWDPIYQRHAWRFLRELVARYGREASILFLDVTPGAETNPYRFGTLARADDGFRDVFAKVRASDGRIYDDALWLETVKVWVDESVRIASGVPLLVTLNVGGMGAGDRLPEIGGYCVSRGCYVGQNGLTGRSYLDPEPRRAGAFLGWAERTTLFFEMAQRSGGRIGTLMEVMRAAERIRCSFLNVYPEDVLKGTRGEKGFDPEFEAALRYGAEALARRAAAPRRATAR